MLDKKIDPSDALATAVTSLKSMSIKMTASSRRTLSRRCAASALESPSLLRRLQRLFELEVPRPAMVAAGAVVVFFGLALALMSLRPDGRLPQVHPSEVKLLSLESDPDGGVTLEWRDGNRRTYTVLKSSDPRDFSRAQSFTVRGNRWTDPYPEATGVTYYRVQ